MSNQILPPAPYGSAIVDKNQKLTPAWVNWIRQLYIQTGGSSSTSLASLITTVANLNTTVTTQQLQIAALQVDIDGLDQGTEI